MQSRAILAPITICGALATMIMIGVQISNQESGRKQGGTGAAVAGQFTGQASSDGSLMTTSSLLMTGVNSLVPKARDIPVVREIPWTLQELARDFRRAGTEMSCRMLEPGIEIIQPLAEPTEGSERALGRRVAFTMSLEVDPAAKSTLPRVTRGAIESYLESHQLTIQTVLYQNVNSELFFGPQVLAGFVAVERPDRTCEPEAMVTASIKELRTLGLYWDKATELVPSQARTLVLAFRYRLQNDVLAKRGPVADQEYELLFLHLLKDSTTSHPNLAVFTTSNARTELSLLDATDPLSTQQDSVIAARVRFGEFNMMGMYPSNPIVTGVFHKAQISLPVDSFKALMEGFASGAPRSLPDVLDELHSRREAGLSGQTANTSAGSAPSNLPETEALSADP
jgi:hypothetical protein